MFFVDRVGSNPISMGPIGSGPVFLWVGSDQDSKLVTIITKTEADCVLILQYVMYVAVTDTRIIDGGRGAEHKIYENFLRLP
jgi:hypothetical protein